MKAAAAMEAAAAASASAAAAATSVADAIATPLSAGATPPAEPASSGGDGGANAKVAELEAQLAAKDAAYLQLQEAYAIQKSELLNFQAAADEVQTAAPSFAKKKFGFGFKKSS